MAFIYYDIFFLILFISATALFLYTHRKNLKRQGILYLYRTGIGLKFIESTTKKYSNLLRRSQYIVVTCGYILMILITIMIVKFSYSYLTSPDIARELRIPVIMPLIPYIDSLFNLDFLPPFYFTYWIIIIAVIAIPHEFFHGIFARLNNIKVHSTGFGFLGPFLAAFVEPDEKQMSKAKKFPQLAILASGTFANILATILFIIFIWVFFALAFSPQGVFFSSYSGEVIPISGISMVMGVPFYGTSLPENFENNSIINLTSNGKTYFTTNTAISQAIEKDALAIFAYEDAPAFKAGLSGAIVSIDGVKTSSYEDLKNILEKKSPGDNINIITYTKEGEKEFNIQLAEKNGKAFLGIGRIDVSMLQRRGLISSLSMKFYTLLDPLKSAQYIDGIYYKSLIGDFGMFIYNLLWWLVVINLSVALVNMLPLGIFDGGRFFLLTIWGITGSKRVGEIAFRISTWIFLILIVLLMVKWLLIFV